MESAFNCLHEKAKNNPLYPAGSIVLIYEGETHKVIQDNHGCNKSSRGNSIIGRYSKDRKSSGRRSRSNRNGSIKRNTRNNRNGSLRKNTRSNKNRSSKRRSLKTPSKARLTKAVALDCEMVGTGPNGRKSMLARVSIVNSNGDCLYDKFVKPTTKVTDYRTKYSGIRPSDLKRANEFDDVQSDVLEMIEGRILVGHALDHDFDVLFITHPRNLIRDTAYYQPFVTMNGGRTPSLKKLTYEILGYQIQSGEHNSVEDAKAAMSLYLKHKRDWESRYK